MYGIIGAEPAYRVGVRHMQENRLFIKELDRAILQGRLIF
jgi:hypothetical protein